MSFLSQLFAKRSSAPVARDRLQILLAHERAEGAGGEGQGELIAKLREEILEVIARHVPIDRDKVQIKLDRGAGVSTLEIDVEMPVGKKPKGEAAKDAPAKTGSTKIETTKVEPVNEPARTGAKDVAPGSTAKLVPDAEATRPEAGSAKPDPAAAADGKAADGAAAAGEKTASAVNS